MSGWELREGTLNKDYLDDDEYWSLFYYVFSDSCKKTNTYKFALIKSICDQIYDLAETDNGYYLTYDEMFAKFTENYWNLVLKYGIRQMTYNGKSRYSKVERIILSACKTYDIPAEAPFQSVNEVQRIKIVKEVSKECRNCVIGALYNDFDGNLYSFSRTDNCIVISKGAYAFISKSKAGIEKMNYYSWAKFLEKTNDEYILTHLLDRLDLATPQRKDLSVYREVLYKEFQEDRCFYCGRKISKSAHVDHFIPWSFIKTDNLWNFVLACSTCNKKKSNRLVGIEYIKKIDDRNKVMQETRDLPFVKRELNNYYTGLIDKIWLYAKKSGFREKQMKKVRGEQ